MHNAVEEKCVSASAECVLMIPDPDMMISLLCFDILL